MQQSLTNTDLMQMADQCVKCAICLPACPTFTVYTTETDSPRGRISLLQGLLNGDIDNEDASLQTHISRCIGCGYCEKACPSSVNFSALMDNCKAEFKLHSRSLATLDAMVNHSAALLNSAKVIPGFIKNLLPDSLRQALDLSVSSQSKSYPDIKSKSHRGEIILFTGCIGKTVDHNAIHAARFVLKLLGFSVNTGAQNCCGALYRHDGYADKADQLATTNQKTFNQLKPDAILYLASGCGAELLKQSYDAPVIELCEFLLPLIDQIQPLLAPIENESFQLHCPCSLYTQTDAWPAQSKFLSALFPDSFQELNGNQKCCGAGGLHRLNHPETANTLLKPKLQALADSGSQTLLTSNTGCAMHFTAGIHNANLAVRVMHPIELIADQMVAKM